jgi:uncharacterized protein YjbJ (UPF0337 family)
MNDDIMAGKRQQKRGHAKEWWGKLTDDDINGIQGKRDVVVGLLQEKCGYTKEKADEEINRRMNEYDRTAVR